MLGILLLLRRFITAPIPLRPETDVCDQLVAPSAFAAVVRHTGD